MEMDRDIDLLGEYAIFLEEILNSGDKKLSEMSILEVVDDRFMAACDYFRNRDGAYLNVMTDYMFKQSFADFPIKLIPFIINLYEIPYKFPNYDEFIQKMSFAYNLDIVYAQMPVNNHEEIIRDLALVPSKTGCVAMFGAYGYKEDGNLLNKKNVMNGFIKCLQSKGLDFARYSKETSDKYFELVMSK